MDKLKEVAKFIFANRRTIGLIIGSSLTLMGLPEYGDFVAQLGEH